MANVTSVKGEVKIPTGTNATEVSPASFDAHGATAAGRAAKEKLDALLAGGKDVATKVGSFLNDSLGNLAQLNKEPGAAQWGKDYNAKGGIVGAAGRTTEAVGNAVGDFLGTDASKVRAKVNDIKAATANDGGMAAYADAVAKRGSAAEAPPTSIRDMSKELQQLVATADKFDKAFPETGRVAGSRGSDDIKGMASLMKELSDGLDKLPPEKRAAAEAAMIKEINLGDPKDLLDAMTTADPAALAKKSVDAALKDLGLTGKVTPQQYQELLDVTAQAATRTNETVAKLKANMGKTSFTEFNLAVYRSLNSDMGQWNAAAGVK